MFRVFKGLKILNINMVEVGYLRNVIRGVKNDKFVCVVEDYVVESVFLKVKF